MANADYETRWNKRDASLLAKVYLWRERQKLLNASESDLGDLRLGMLGAVWGDAADELERVLAEDNA